MNVPLVQKMKKMEYIPLIFMIKIVMNAQQDIMEMTLMEFVMNVTQVVKSVSDQMKTNVLNVDLDSIKKIP